MKRNNTAMQLLEYASDRAWEYQMLMDKHDAPYPDGFEDARHRALKLLTSRIVPSDALLAKTFNDLQAVTEAALETLYQKIHGVGVKETPRQALERLLDEPLANPFLVAAVYQKYLEEVEAIQAVKAGDKT